MALIKCPECGKEISDKSDICVNCGYPIKKQLNNQTCNINGIDYDFSFIRDINNITQPEKLTYIEIIMQNAKCDFEDACKLMNEIISTKNIPSSYTFEIMNSVNDTFTPKCPTCGSTKIERISGLSKAGSVALWGIFSRKIHKQWHCNSCGSEW